MDEHQRALDGLRAAFRRDREAAAKRRRHWWQGRIEGRGCAWLLAFGVIALILSPLAFILLYPRLGPADTMTTFCTDEQVGAYATAYGLLSKRAQAHISRVAFVQMSQSIEIMECRPYHGIPLILGDSTAQLDVRYQYGSGHTFGTMGFVREQGGWRIDSMDPDFFHLSS